MHTKRTSPPRTTTNRHPQPPPNKQHQVGRLRCLEALGDYPSLLDAAKCLRSHLLLLSSSSITTAAGTASSSSGPHQHHQHQQQQQQQQQWRDWMAQTLLLGSKAALALGEWGDMDAFLTTRRELASSSSTTTTTLLSPLWAGAAVAAATAAPAAAVGGGGMVMAGFTAAPEEDPLLYEAALQVRFFMLYNII